MRQSRWLRGLAYALAYNAAMVVFALAFGAVGGRTAAVAAIGAFMGIALGDYLKAFLWRRKQGVSIAEERLRCPACDSTLSWRENIPLVSFAMQRGRCLHCRIPIPWSYPAFQLAGGAVGALLLGLAAALIPA